jgi:glycosyltransferase involved in cell wall biosynthesis
MKVLIITAMFPPNRTGTSFYSRNLANSIQYAGNEVQVITTANELENEDEQLKFSVTRIPAWHFPLKNYFKHLRFCGLIPGNYKNILGIVRNFQPDAIVLINHYLDIAFPAIYASMKAKVPLYISVGTQLQSLNPVRNKTLRFLDRLIVGNLIFPFAKRIISWDKEIERYITEVHKKKNADKSIIIPFGVNGNIEEFEKYNNIYEEENQILGVGAIIDHRDYVYQVRVFSELVKKHPDLKLKIIGNHYVDKPMKLVKALGLEDKVIFPGELPHEQVLEEYKKSMLHWMMLVGEYVGLGTSTLEAMLMGVPSISNVPDNLFGFGAMRDMENFVHTNGNNISEDIEKINKLIEDKELRRKIGENGKVFIQKHLNWEVVAKQYETMIINDTK